jgi:PLP dependent protein
MAMSFPGEVMCESQSNRRPATLQRRACYDLNSNDWDMATTSIRENLLRVEERISAAARRAGRRSEEITLIGVSKTHPAEAIREAYEAGLRHFGENRVQEWEGKQGGIQELSATWHLIGHLQSNKAARAAKLFQSIDSVDGSALAQRLDRARSESGGTERMRVLIEVHIAKEEAKSGAAVEELPALAEKIAALPKLELAGLMCIPPFTENAEEARPHFRRLRELRDDLTKRLRLGLPVLSMGMSHDFEVAIEEGATEVRVGTALFGTRGAMKVGQ